jgi:CHAT domain-containing protein/Tfp pilus assembly protein PilF
VVRPDSTSPALAALTVKVKADVNSEKFADAVGLIRARMKSESQNRQSREDNAGAPCLDSVFATEQACLWNLWRRESMARRHILNPTAKSPAVLAAADQLALRHGLADVEDAWGWYLAAHSNTTKAIAEFNAAYESDKADRPVNAAAELVAIGEANFGLSQYKESIVYFAKALPIFRKAGSAAGQAYDLMDYGNAYLLLSRYTDAMEYYKQAMPLFEKAGNADGAARDLMDIGIANYDLSRFARAVYCFQQLLPIYKELGDTDGQARDYMNCGNAYFALADYTKAEDAYQRALLLFTMAGNRDSEAGCYLDSANVYEQQGNHDKALAQYQEALAIFRDVGDRDGEARDRMRTGCAYTDMGQCAKAADYFQQALPIFVEAGDLDGEARNLMYAGDAYSGMGMLPDAVDHYQQALSVFRQGGDRQFEATCLKSLMGTWGARGQPRLAIFYGKQAVNVLQSIRADERATDRTGHQMLDTQTQSTYTASVSDTYRTLADLLIGQGRLPEAQQVLGLLKRQELKDFLRGDEPAHGELAQVDLTPVEQNEDAQYSKIENDVIALGQQKQALLDKKKQAGAGKGVFGDADQKSLDDVQANLVAAAHHLNTFLSGLETAFSSSSAGSGDLQARLQSVKKARDIQDTLRQLHAEGKNVVVLETVVAPDRYAVIVTTAQVQKVEQFAIKAEDLNKKVADFQSALRDPTVDPRPLAFDLYKILVAPVEVDLQQAGATTLMWSLDGALRYVPFSALYDGRQYLVERFDNDVFTLGSQSGFGADEREKWEGLGLGVSLPHSLTDPVTQEKLDFPPLHAVPAELQAVIQSATSKDGVVPGDVLLDPDFSQATMTHALEEGKYNVVHVASHFSIRPGDPDNSFLLLGDGGRLSLAQMADDTTLFQGVDLLALSACDTATGSTDSDGKEVDSLGSIAQDDGAKSVLASLWPVSDNSTRLLMQTFYRLHETQAAMTKAEALRQAQLSLLHGASGESGTSRRGTEAVETTQTPSNSRPTFVADPKAPYAHPFYWAPFILIGNWR